MRKLILKDSEWGRGSTAPGSLFNPESRRKCCLGVLLSACGVPDADLKGGYPAGWLNAPWSHAPNQDVLAGVVGLIERIGERYYLNTALALDLAKHNDDWDHPSDESRVRAMTPLFASIGWEVEFRANE